MPKQISHDVKFTQLRGRRGHSKFPTSSPYSELLEALHQCLFQTMRAKPGAFNWSESTPIPDEHDTVGLIQAAIQSNRFHQRHLRDSYSAEPGDAIRDDDEQNPGKQKIVFRSRDGYETTYRGLDPTTSAAAYSGQHDLRAFEQIASSILIQRDEDIVLRDDRINPIRRLEALGRLLNSPRQEESIAYLVSELGHSTVQSEWRDALVFSAEDLHFPPRLRETVADRLLSIASTLRTESEGREKVVWSALRRGASLLAPQEAERILPFLEKGLVDTRAVALQAISRLFEPRPPDSTPISVANRVHQFAAKFLDPDVFTAGEPSLIARNAVAALASVADPRLQSVLENVVTLKRGFLTRRVVQELSRIRSGWLDREASHDHPALKNIEAGLARLSAPSRPS